MTETQSSSTQSSSTQSSRAPARDRILVAASDLFYREGVQNVGVDRIIAESGVAKMSLYNHFKSKDALIAAWLQQRDEKWRAWFQERVDSLAAETGNGVLVVFDVLKEWFEQPDFRGCAFINSTVELVDPEHPGYRVALEHQRAMFESILNLVRAANTPHPEALARQLFILVEGAIVVAMMHHSSEPAIQAKQAAAVLIDNS